MARGLKSEHYAARSSKPRPEHPSEPLHGHNTEPDSGILPESCPEVHPEPDPESQMAFIRPSTPNDSFLISSLTKFRLGFGVGHRVGHRVAFRAALGAAAGAGIGSWIGVELDPALRWGAGGVLREIFRVPFMV